MFYVVNGNESLVYTGDYSMIPDRHLKAAYIDKLHPNVLLTETTYSFKVRTSRRAIERRFLRDVYECVSRGNITCHVIIITGGKVLIPTFAVGRAQEICILLDTYWERMGLSVPIYIASGLTAMTNNLYTMFTSWMNEQMQESVVAHNSFQYKHVLPWDRNVMNRSMVCVISV